MLHGCLALREGHAGTTLRIGNQQRPCLVNAIAPLRDIVAVQTAAGLVGRVLLHQLAGAAHRLLAIAPRMVEVRQIQTDTYQRTNHTHRSCLQQVFPCGLALAPESLDDEGYDHRRDDEQIVIGHLHVIGLHLEGSKDGRHHEAPQILPTIGQHDTANQGRQISQRHHLPQVTSGNDDEEIAGEGPHDGSQRGQIPTEVEGPQQDIEAQQVGKHEPYVLGQPQVIGIDTLLQHRGAVVRRRRLVSRHTAEHGIRPTADLTRSLVILIHLLANTFVCRRVMAIQDTSLDVSGEEIGKRDSYEQQHYQHVGQPLLIIFHTFFL